MKKLRSVHVFYVFLIISLFACQRSTDLLPEVAHSRINFKMKDVGCGDVWGFVNKEDSIYLYQINYDYIKFKSVDNNNSNEVVYEFPAPYNNPFSSRIADVLPISNEELVISTIDDSYNICITLYDCIENVIDTICNTGMRDEVYFSGAMQGDMDNIYHQSSNTVFFTAVDFSVSETEQQALDMRCVYQLNLTTGDHSFIDLKYPENYLSRIKVSMTNDCFFNEYNKDLLIVFPMDETVYKYNPADESVDRFVFEEFEHNPVLSSDTTINSMEAAKQLYLQTFQYYRVFYDDSTKCYYRFYGDTATSQHPNQKSVGFALYDDNRKFLNKFSVDTLNLGKSLNSAIMTKKGLLYIEEINKENDFIELGYLRAR